jgi:MULE transposase domain
MTNKSQALYQSVISAINDVAFSETGKEPSPEVIISDFELAILGAAAFQFPSSRKRGCWLHFSHAIFKYATNKLGLKPSYNHNSGVKKIIRMLNALAILQPSKAREGFQVNLIIQD